VCRMRIRFRNLNKTIGRQGGSGIVTASSSPVARPACPGWVHLEE